jgi:hypothetical protein
LLLWFIAVALAAAGVSRIYLLTLARDRLGTWASVMLTALLFALTVRLHWDHFAERHCPPYLVCSGNVGIWIALMTLMEAGR